VTSRSSAFPAVAAASTKVLILGSLPGAASLAAAQYYAHPRNLFWPLLGTVIDRPELPALPYADRLNVIGSAGIGLWDVYASAERRGSLDQAIRAGEAAALADLIAELPKLRAIAFNGKKASEAGRRQLGGHAVTLIDLPSSSPANAAIPFAEKRQRWLALKHFLAADLNPPAPMDIGMS
jgi:double-stranded uracil-DNA glycosylase